MKAREKRRLLLLTLTLACAAIAVTGWWWHRERSRPRVTINDTTWNVELAITTNAHRKGLAGRDSLADDAGMLFIYPREEVMTFWMKDCLIPLDIAFIDKDMRVINIETMPVEPAGDTRYSSNKPAKFALEVPAGALKKAGVGAGSKVIFSGDIPVPAKANSSP